MKEKYDKFKDIEVRDIEYCLRLMRKNREEEDFEVIIDSNDIYNNCSVTQQSQKSCISLEIKLASLQQQHKELIDKYDKIQQELLLYKQRCDRIDYNLNVVIDNLHNEQLEEDFKVIDGNYWFMRLYDSLMTIIGSSKCCIDDEKRTANNKHDDESSLLCLSPIPVPPRWVRRPPLA